MSNVSSWKFTTTSEAAWEEMLRACEQAEKSIDLEQYIFGTEGAIIEKLLPLLKKKSAEGIKVRLLLDWIGSFPFFSSVLPQELEEAGIEIVFHKTTIPPSVKRLLPFLLRDHRKLIVFDEKEAHISGVIIEERARDWRDTSVIIEGSIVKDCADGFNAVWAHAKLMTPLGRVLPNEGNGEFYLAGNSFRLRDKPLYRSIVRQITMAKKTIYITTPYFWLTRGLRRALWNAKEKGVEIYFLFPKRSDNLLSDIVARFFYRRLLRKKVHIFHYTHSMLHAKSVCVDGNWATVGSCNLDWLSIWLNYELNINTKNITFVQELESIFLKDLSESEEVTLHTKGWYGLFSL